MTDPQPTTATEAMIRAKEADRDPEHGGLTLRMLPMPAHGPEFEAMMDMMDFSRREVARVTGVPGMLLGSPPEGGLQRYFGAFKTVIRNENLPPGVLAMAGYCDPSTGKFVETGRIINGRIINGSITDDSFADLPEG